MYERERQVMLHALLTKQKLTLLQKRWKISKLQQRIERSEEEEESVSRQRAVNTCECIMITHTVAQTLTGNVLITIEERLCVCNGGIEKGGGS